MINCVKVSFSYYNREEVVYIHSLEELAAWIDDFGTDHCEGDLQLWVHLDGKNEFVKANIFCDIEVKS